MHAHQFWWVWSLRFQRYCCLSKTAKFPFWGMDYSPWSSKNLINWNRLKKIMQVGIDIKCMHTSFGWVWSLQFQRYCYLSKTAKFPFWGMDYSPWLLKNLIDWNWLKKFTQVGIDVKCMHTDFGGRGLSGFGDKISLWSIKVKKFNLSESAKKIIQVGIDIKCMHTSFGGCGLSGFRDIATFQKRPNFPFRAWTIVHGHRKI